MRGWSRDGCSHFVCEHMSGTVHSKHTGKHMHARARTHLQGFYQAGIDWAGDAIASVTYRAGCEEERQKVHDCCLGSKRVANYQFTQLVVRKVTNSLLMVLPQRIHAYPGMFTDTSKICFASRHITKHCSRSVMRHIWQSWC